MLLKVSPQVYELRLNPITTHAKDFFIVALQNASRAMLYHSRAMGFKFNMQNLNVKGKGLWILWKLILIE